MQIHQKIWFTFKGKTSFSTGHIRTPVQKSKQVKKKNKFKKEGNIKQRD